MDGKITVTGGPRTGRELEAARHGDTGIIGRFLSSLDVRERTRLTYRWAMDRFIDWVEGSGRSLDRLGPQDIVAYKDFLQKERLSPLTVGGYLSAVRQFYRWTEQNMVYPNIARSVRPPRSGRKGFRKMHLTGEEADRLLEMLEGRSLRDFAIVNLMLRTGLRTIEVSRADVRDIRRMKGRRVLRVWGKGRDGRDEFVILNDPAWKPLRRYLRRRSVRSREEPLFVTDGKGHRGSRMSPRLIQHMVKESLREIGLDSHEYSAHSLRHTTAVMILLNGGDWKDVQRVLRHVSPATSQIYTATIENDVRLERNPESLLDGAFGRVENKQ